MEPSKISNLIGIEDLPYAEIYLIAGPTAAGKTTFSSILAVHLNAVVLPMDDYYLDEDQAPLEYNEEYGKAPQWESPEAYDIELLLSNIGQLLDKGEVWVPEYSFSQNKRTGYRVLPRKLEQSIIVEGLYAIKCKPLLVNMSISTIAIFVTATESVREVRARTRDTEERGKPDELFTKRFHFMRIGEQRWLLKQAEEADFTLDTSEGFSWGHGRQI
jgi:uridine kinase